MKNWLKIAMLTSLPIAALFAAEQSKSKQVLYQEFKKRIDEKSVNGKFIFKNGSTLYAIIVDVNTMRFMEHGPCGDAKAYVPEESKNIWVRFNFTDPDFTFEKPVYRDYSLKKYETLFGSDSLAKQ